jgi:hypothetical protein
MKSLRVLPILPLVVSLAACQASKSSNPLSPTVAGPIPGVSITPPTPIDPAGARVPVSSQPLTLVAANASTTGVRPLTYLFEVATDAGFANKVFSRDAVTPSDSGRTSLRLPDALQTGRTYYWRAQAHDGANTSPYSSPANFDVFTPVTIGQPNPVSPVAAATVTSLHPTFVIGNASRSGPAGTIGYTIVIADNPAFSNPIAVWNVTEQPNQTSLASLQDFSAAQTYYWRVRAYDPTTTGDWSATQSFRTPAAAAPPPPPSGGGATLSEPAMRAFIISNAAGLNPENPSSLQAEIDRLRVAGYSASVLMKSPGVPSDHKTWINGAEWSLISSDGFLSGTYRWDPYIQVPAPPGGFSSCGRPLVGPDAGPCS